MFSRRWYFGTLVPPPFLICTTTIVSQYGAQMFNSWFWVVLEFQVNKHPEFIMGVISTGWKWWLIVWEIENLSSQGEVSAGLFFSLSLLSFLGDVGKRGQGNFFVFFLFPMCSHQVPKVFPKFSMCFLDVPTKTSFFIPLLLFGHGSTSMDIICRGVEGWVWRLECKGPKGKMTKHASIWGEGSIFRLLCWGVPHALEILVIDQTRPKMVKNVHRQKIFLQPMREAACTQGTRFFFLWGGGGGGGGHRKREDFFFHFLFFIKIMKQVFLKYELEVLTMSSLLH
jgi:hypothetical protein